MEKCIASLLNSSTSGNIFDLEGDGVRELIQDYFASNSACNGNDFDRDSEEETDCKQTPELDCKETPLSARFNGNAMGMARGARFILGRGFLSWGPLGSLSSFPLHNR